VANSNREVIAMGSSRIHAGLGASMGLLVLFAAASSKADEDKQEAKRHFEAGLALAEAEDFVAAAVEFESSVALFPTKMGLFNLANCYKALHRYAEALDVIVRLRSTYQGKLSAEMVREVAEFERSVTALVGRLEVKVEPAGASVMVDGKNVGVSPLPEPLLLAPGDHEVKVEFEGYRPETRKVRVTSRGREEVMVDLAPLPPPAAGIEMEPPEGDAVDTLPPWDEGGKLGPAPLITAGALAVGFGVATVVLGVKAGDKEQEAVDAHDDALMDDAGKLQTAGRVMLGLTGAALVTTAVLLFFTDFGGGEDEAFTPALSRGERGKGNAASDLRVDGVWPVAFDSGAGVAVGGRF
jgi:hypothetical protein